MKIPKQLQVGGQEIEVSFEDRLDNDYAGLSNITRGFIKIARKPYGKEASESSILNTFVHECVHTILDSMGEYDLSKNEVFVSSFAGFATELIKSLKYDD